MPHTWLDRVEQMWREAEAERVAPPAVVPAAADDDAETGSA